MTSPTLRSWHRIRTARKAWRCVGADPTICHEVVIERGPRRLTSGSLVSSSTSRRRLATAAEAEAYAAQRRAVDDPSVLSIDVRPVPNSDYRPDVCLVEIPVGTRYLEDRGEALDWESGTRYCAGCARAAYGVEVDR